MNKYFVDNRNIRDMYYAGELVVEYDDSKHSKYKDKISKIEALKIILDIMEMDLTQLEKNLNVIIEYDRKMVEVPKELQISHFFTPSFYKIVKNKINEGFKFLHYTSESEYLTEKDLNSFIKDLAGKKILEYAD